MGRRPRAAHAPSQKAANRAQLRSPGERTNAQSRPGTSCVSSAAAPGRPASWPRPFTSFRTARSKD